jgi:membrane protease YdiL (CAAX protease family)
VPALGDLLIPAALLGPAIIALASSRGARRIGELPAALFGQSGLVLLSFGAAAAAGLGRTALPPPGGWARSGVEGLALAAFFVLVFGPLAQRALALSGAGRFEAGLGRLARLPLSYMVGAVLIGGVAEEVLYRAFAWTRLADLSGSSLLAGAVVVALFGAAHLPLWGPGPARTAVVSGALLTAFYAWRQDLVANVVAHVATDLVGIVGPALRAGRGGAPRL